MVERRRPRLADVVASKREAPGAQAAEPERRVKVSLDLPLSLDLRLTTAAKRANISKRKFVEELLAQHLPAE